MCVCVCVTVSSMIINARMGHHGSPAAVRQYPFLTPSVRGPQMAGVCVCEGNKPEVSTTLACPHNY